MPAVQRDKRPERPRCRSRKGTYTRPLYGPIGPLRPRCGGTVRGVSVLVTGRYAVRLSRLTYSQRNVTISPRRIPVATAKRTTSPSTSDSVASMIACSSSRRARRSLPAGKRGLMTWGTPPGRTIPHSRDMPGSCTTVSLLTNLGLPLAFPVFDSCHCDPFVGRRVARLWQNAEHRPWSAVPRAWGESLLSRGSGVRAPPAVPILVRVCGSVRAGQWFYSPRNHSCGISAQATWRCVPQPSFFRAQMSEAAFPRVRRRSARAGKACCRWSPMACNGACSPCDPWSRRPYPRTKRPTTPVSKRPRQTGRSRLEVSAATIPISTARAFVPVYAHPSKFATLQSVARLDSAPHQHCVEP
ncbi:hypothetical protein SAMN06265784_101681 [Paraburkholderia susongensis]|uniref:Uncharacterized protein n=1 Tax=Paraburkholderia susongensis TaxID=1515439 RepID=A0A1X7IHC8_9BURK|nr:hypothetical protein SAMN06265784_101681 [Paraburkholderia susongensis]